MIKIFARWRKQTLPQLVQGRSLSKCQHRHVVYGDPVMRYTSRFASGGETVRELRAWVCRDCRESGQNTLDALLEWTKAGRAIYNPDLYLALANPSEIVRGAPK